MLNGVDDGARTHDRRDHNPELYQLSYVHHGLIKRVSMRQNSAYSDAPSYFLLPLLSLAAGTGVPR